ncbi:hypothetical protein BGX24_006071, partial [Mortierella sp. AD032]
MSALRTNTTTIARTVFAAISRRAVIRQQAPIAARSFSILAKTNAHPSVTNAQFQQQRQQGFATSLADFSSKMDDNLDEAQQYMDEGVSFLNNNMIPLAMSSFQKSINVRPT